MGKTQRFDVNLIKQERVDVLIGRCLSQGNTLGFGSRIAMRETEPIELWQRSVDGNSEISSVACFWGALSVSERLREERGRPHMQALTLSRVSISRVCNKGTVYVSCATPVVVGYRLLAHTSEITNKKKQFYSALKLVKALRPP